MSKAFFELPPETFNGKIPFVISDLIEHAKEIHIENVVGVFRINGNESVIKSLISELNHGRIKDWSKYDVHSVTTAIKRYFGKMAQNNPIIPYEYYSTIIKIMKTKNLQNSVTTLSQIVQTISSGRRTTLAYLMDFLKFVASHSDVNKMTSSNIAICFGPNIIVSPQVTKEMLYESAQINEATTLMIDYYDALFSNVKIDSSVFCTEEDVSFLLRPPPHLSNIQYQINRCESREGHHIPFVPICRLVSSSEICRPQYPPPPKPSNTEESNISVIESIAIRLQSVSVPAFQITIEDIEIDDPTYLSDEV